VLVAEVEYALDVAGEPTLGLVAIGEEFGAKSFVARSITQRALILVTASG
jgi:hypothetical protein